MRRNDRKRKKFRDVFSLLLSLKSFMRDREVNHEETQSRVHDQNLNRRICIEPWLRTNQVWLCSIDCLKTQWFENRSIKKFRKTTLETSNRNPKQVLDALHLKNPNIRKLTSSYSLTIRVQTTFKIWRRNQTELTQRVQDDTQRIMSTRVQVAWNQKVKVHLISDLNNTTTSSLKCMIIFLNRRVLKRALLTITPCF